MSSRNYPQRHCLQVQNHVAEYAFLADLGDLCYEPCELPVKRGHLGELDVLLSPDGGLAAHQSLEGKRLSLRFPPAQPQ